MVAEIRKLLHKARQRAEEMSRKAHAALEPHATALNGAYEERFPETAGMTGRGKLRHALRAENRSAASAVVREHARTRGIMAVDQGHKLLERVRRRLEKNASRSQETMPPADVM